MALRLQNTSQWQRASVTAVMCFTLTLDSLTELVGHLSHLTQWIRLVVIVFLQHAVMHPQTMLIKWQTRLHFNQTQTPSVNTEQRDKHTFFYVLNALFYVPPYVCHSRSVITTPLNRCINNTVYKTRWLPLFTCFKWYYMKFIHQEGRIQSHKANRKK